MWGICDWLLSGDCELGEGCEGGQVEVSRCLGGSEQIDTRVDNK